MRYTKEQAASKNCRTRNWMSILYPDSAPEDWRDRLRDAGVQAFVSPLHCMDVNGDGEAKKAHYHIIVMYSNVKAWWQVNELFADIGALSGFAGDGKSSFMAIDDLRISARYLCHMDNPEKYRYKEDDVLCFGGADYGAIAALPSDDDLIMDEISRFVTEYGVLSYRQLLCYARDNRRDWFRYLNHKGSRHVYQLIKSAQWEYNYYGRYLNDNPVDDPINRQYMAIQRNNEGSVNDEV